MFAVIAIGACPQREIHHDIGRNRRGGLQFQRLGDALPQSGQNFPVMHRTIGLIKYRGVISRRIAHGVDMKSQIIMVMFKR